MAGHCLLQIVDVVRKDAVELCHRLRNVPRNGNINEKHRTILAPGQKLLAVFAPENCVWRTGRGDHNVGLIARAVKILELNGLSVELLSQPDRAIVSAIRNEDGSAPMRHQMPRRQFAHLACADDKNVLPLQRAEDLLCQFDSHGRNRYRRRSHRGLAAHPLGDRKRAAEKLVQLSANRAHRSRRRVGFLHLTQNLRLSHHHGIQAGSHAKQVPNGILLPEFVEMGIQFFRLQMKMIMQESPQVGMAIDRMGDHLDPVAGRDHDTFFDSGVSRKLAARIRQARFRDGQPLADFEWRALVIHADELESHEAANLWIAEK